MDKSSPARPLLPSPPPRTGHRRFLWCGLSRRATAVDGDGVGGGATEGGRPAEVQGARDVARTPPVQHTAAATSVLEAKVFESGVTPVGGGEPQSKRVTRSASAKKSLDAKDVCRLGPGHGGDVAMSGICGIAEASGLKGAGNSCCAGVGVATGDDCKSNFSASARE
jgi:hypothetical protein